jgi:hypothetical protein
MYRMTMPRPNRIRRTALAVLFVLVCLATPSTASGPYHGNVESWIFHASHCRWYRCKHCTAVFETRQEAIDGGYRPCKVCKP